MSGIGKAHNKYISCAGCPHRRADPNCHTDCTGYKYRMKKNEERKEKIQAGRKKKNRVVYRGFSSDEDK